MFFKCKKEECKPKVYEMKSLNIGRTKVNLVFKDGRELIIYIYGHQKLMETDLVSSSLSDAQDFVKDYYHSHVGVYLTFCDDYKNPKISYSGEIISKEILSTEDFYETYKVLVKKEL